MPGVRVACAVFALTLAVYCVTVDRGVDFADYGDFQVVPYILGITYPTGFPGYTLIGWAWSHVLPIGSVALRLNLLSAVAASSSNALLAASLIEIGIAPLVCGLAAIAYGLSYQTWTHANAASPHEVGTAFLLASLYASIRWAERGGRRVPFVAGISYACALACDNSTILALPGLVLIGSGRTVRPWVWLRVVLIGCAIETLAYAYLPIRSAIVTGRHLDPTRALGLAPGYAFWDQGHPSQLRSFIGVVSGSAYNTSGTFLTMLSPHQILRTWNDLTGQITTAFGSIGLALSIIFVVVLARERGRLASGLLAIALASALYMSSYRAESDVARYVPRTLIVIVVAGAWAYARFCKTRWGAAPAGRFAVLLVCVTIGLADRSAFARLLSDRSDRDGRAFVASINHVAPRGAIVIAPWKYASPLAYGAYVEASTSARIVVCCDMTAAAGRARGWSDTRTVMLVADASPARVAKGLHLRHVLSLSGTNVWRISRN